MHISKDFTGGNIEVVSISEHEVVLKNERRDSADDWFYWAFCVEGAEGKTVRFRFDQKNRIGHFGAAVSTDLIHWRWSENDQDESFTYTFGEAETRVYFAHDMLYHTSRLQALGFTLPRCTIGEGDRSIVLTARHHCCEATGSYVLEGVLRELSAHPLEGYQIFCVPFVDLDGVLHGDQGKGRIPHDHNRDYDETTPPLYPSTAAIREYALTHNVRFAFDFHSPWHKGKQNDNCFIVRHANAPSENFDRFGTLFEQSITETAFTYRHANDFPADTDWNRSDSPTFARFMAIRPTCELAFTLETAYFGKPDNVFSEDRAIELGRCFARALRKYTET